MKSLFVSVLVIYALLCLVLFLLQKSFLYFPRELSQILNESKIELLNGEQKLSGWIINPNQSKAIIYYGGNAEAIEYNAEFFKSIFPDWSVVLVPYRGYGGNSGSPSEKGLYSDAIHVYDQVKSNYETLVLMGRSLGSGVATYVASERSVDGIILITPYDSIVGVAKDHYGLFPVDLLVTERYESAARMKNIEVATLVVMAENDRVILRARSEALAQAIAPEFLQKYIVEGADHNDIGLYPEYALKLRKFVANF